MRPKCLVLRAAGTNCDLETAEAIKIAGGDPEILHINVLIKGEKKLDDYQMLVIPGGFSYADSISAGKILSNILKNNLKHQLKKFIDEGKPVLGVCNGFQALIKSGFLPFSNEVNQSASLIINKNGLFIDTWVYLKINPKSICLLTKNSPNVIYLPINHGEGRFVCNKKN
jgi:Phosphoribosylformylglycinamidine (FGAM) synthase, glutamine amidotransferase domain